MQIFSILVYQITIYKYIKISNTCISMWFLGIVVNYLRMQFRLKVYCFVNNLIKVNKIMIFLYNYKQNKLFGSVLIIGKHIDFHKCSNPHRTLAGKVEYLKVNTSCYTKLTWVSNGENWNWLKLGFSDSNIWEQEGSCIPAWSEMPNAFLTWNWTLTQFDIYLS